MASDEKVFLAAPGYEPEHVERYLREWAADQREREAWKDDDQSTYRFRARTLEGALAALLAARERAENEAAHHARTRERCEIAERKEGEEHERAYRAERERDGLAREVRRARKLRDKPGGLAVMSYDEARAANEAQGWPSGGQT